MFVPIWLIFLTSGLLLAIGTLVWSIKTNQFEEQQRARYLPLSGLSPEELADQPPVRAGVNLYVLLGLMVVGLFSIVLTILVMVQTL